MAVTADDVRRAFQNSLGREPSQADIDSYVAVSQSGALTDTQIYQTISNSREADLVSDPVIRFYQAVFGRVPDAAGLDNTQDYIRAFTPSAQTYIALAEQFAQSQEFINRFGSGTDVNAGYVQALYTTILGRTATSAEIDGYTSGSNGYTTRGGVLYAISQSQEAINISNNAVNGFLLNAAEGDAVYTGSLYTADNGQPNLPSQGQTIPLKQGVEVATGTDFADTFLGSVSFDANGTATGTFDSGDNISGGGGSDTLRVIVSNNQNFNGALITPTLTSVENVEVQAVDNFGGNFTNINLINSSGVEKISLVNGFGNVDFFNVNNKVDLAASGTQGGGLSIQYNPNLTGGTTDVQNISLNNASPDIINIGNPTDISVDGIETFAITATGTNNVTLNQQTFGNDTLTAVTVAGAGSVAITTDLSAQVTTFDASASTGAVTVGFTDGGDVTATGGTGNDTFNFNGGLTTADVVNGGAGTDTVKVTTGGDLTSADAAAPFNNLTSIETVEFDGAGVTLNGSTFTNTGITTLLFNTAGDDVINNAGSARTYQFGTGNTGDATFALKADVTSLKIDLLGSVGTAAANDGTDANIDSLTITTAGANATTTPVSVALTSQGDLADTFFGSTSTKAVAFNGAEVNETGLVTAASGSTFTVTGAGNLAIFGGPTDGSAVTAGFANNVTLTASSATGNSVLSGSDFLAANLGAPGTNTDATVSGVDTFNLGAGKDIVVFSTGLSSGVEELGTVNGADGVATGNILTDTITNFTAGSGGDVLSRDVNLSNGINTGAAANYTAISADTQAQINALAGGGATLRAAADLATADAAQNWTAFSFQGTTYALFDTANGATYQSGSDTLVKLTGVTIANLTDANFSV